MTIYSSDKAVPYVYLCTHKETGKFYIGYREANVKLNRPSHLDLPEYKTSSTVVNPEWSNYTWTIVAEFFDPSHAYTFEQQMICDNWKNPLLLNGQYRLGKIKQFRNSGSCSDKSKKKMSDARKGKPTWNKGISTGPNKKKGQPAKNKGIPSGKKGIPNGRKGIPSPLKGIPNGKKGKPNGKKGKPNGRKGKPSPLKGIPSGKKGIPNGPSGKQQNPSGPRPKVECPHCGKIGGGGSNMTRYHFDNCKKKPI